MTISSNSTLWQHNMKALFWAIAQLINEDWCDRMCLHTAVKWRSSYSVRCRNHLMVFKCWNELLWTLTPHQHCVFCPLEMLKIHQHAKTIRQRGGCVGVVVCWTDLNVLTSLFRSVEMSFMVRRSGPTMFLRLHNTETSQYICAIRGI